ncbi:MAG: N-acetylglucosamine-6-phosphate deacetylase [Acetobacter fabarum]|jgi:N-acetylglucosamine-6-phosphate deacetylase|uniref:N-acetylglucosamine-6-phosphate deacetylase n=1 Tax=Acetobacter fabarum TaxID=483199 RepID=UPI00242B13CF|nr:N-acetylglucosamine-6-phosphate deacetylase [Acetobacter fabarum]MCH4025438.1 N-acetylglucosamine-6-phosphate deacetylase [Acetobacter fabarum]MCH4086702.1 N-acetylglucosamine-6-phosphate deacetylase [Acetobacter fabarum]MCH4128254.1 N-acetylglucosamine-6-phosphate deacetylase [Acetobacter fabarum]MCH4138576.1 N-acetylglucosamine-6-phosphate deacetylase [Acetobacter fabarum]MCH4141538.1 N-acetylglucosamine-6-phosphate deacetylase [Acetobacter fabarum]
MTELRGHLVLPERIVPGHVTFAEQIQAVTPDNAAIPDRYILPGFIDGHVHGGNGADTMDGVQAIHTLARFHARHGTTTILPTTITSPWADVLGALAAIAEVCGTTMPDGPNIHGAHLEGPFVSPHRLGAQPPHALAPTPERVAEVLAFGCVRVVTLAPELPHAQKAMQLFAQAGVRVSLGHTLAGYEETEQAICRICSAGGITGATHLFNAMAGIESRKPGPATALMCSDAYAELIFDTHHVHPATFRLAQRVMPERLLFVTDAMRAAGLPDGPSLLGGQQVMVEHGAVRLPGGNLAGSVLTLDTALRNAVQAGLPLHQAAVLLTRNPAQYLGLHDRGTLHAGKRADFVVMDNALTVQEVWVAGQRIA